MDRRVLRSSTTRSRPLHEYGTVTFPARPYDHHKKNSGADPVFWRTRATESQKHRAYLVTRFAPDEFVAKDYLNHVWSKPTIVNGLDPRTHKTRNKIFGVKWAFRDSGDAAVIAVKDLLLNNLFGVQPDVLKGQATQQKQSGETCGQRIWAAEVDLPILDQERRATDQMQLVRMEVLACPIWMRHPDDEIPFMKGFSTSKGELADLFAITVTILLRDSETGPGNTMGDRPNACEQRNRFWSYAHVCIDRDIAIAAWLDAIYKHGDQYFKPEGDMQLPGGQSVGLWPPEGRLDLHWEGKTLDYEAIFICVTSMCFESIHTDASDALIGSAIDKIQQKRDGYLGLDPHDDYVLRMLQKKMTPEKPMRLLRYTKKPPTETLPEHPRRPKTPEKPVFWKEKQEQCEVSPDSSLSSADESPERPPWMEIMDSSSTIEEVVTVENQKEGGKMENDNTPSTSSDEQSAEERMEYLSSAEASPERILRTTEKPRTARRRRMAQRRTRATRGGAGQPPPAGAQRRRQIAEMNPEMERFARGI